MSGPNGEGLPPTTAALPTHILVTDEMVDRAYVAASDALSDPHNHIGPDEMRAALSAVAPELFAAGMRAAMKLSEVNQAQRDETEEERDTTREVGAGSSYELGPGGQVRPVE